jgi:hypothetical protein
MKQQGLRFDPRFLDRYAGTIIADARIALVELVANCWDAYATQVRITWPDADRRVAFAIADDGEGMTASDFEVRWSTLDYDRVRVQGRFAIPPPDLKDARKRRAFGRNGRGRHAAFHFCESYTVTTWRDGTEVEYRVTRGTTKPLKWERLRERARKGHGTIIRADKAGTVRLDAKSARAVVGARFLSDPSFNVTVDDEQVQFKHLPAASMVTEVYPPEPAQLPSPRPLWLLRGHGEKATYHRSAVGGTHREVAAQRPDLGGIRPARGFQRRPVELVEMVPEQACEG